MTQELSTIKLQKGKNFFTLNSVEIERDSDIFDVYELQPPLIDFSNSISFECKSEGLDFFTNIYNGELKCGDLIDIYHLTPVGYEQARKHKKKRINKKWLKKYGYKTKYKKVKTTTKYVDSKPVFSENNTGNKMMIGLDMILDVVQESK